MVAESRWTNDEVSLQCSQLKHIYTSEPWLHIVNGHVAHVSLAALGFLKKTDLFP
jgi:hypothetical protein